MPQALQMRLIDQEPRVSFPRVPNSVYLRCHQLNSTSMEFWKGVIAGVQLLDRLRCTAFDQ